MFADVTLAETPPPRRKQAGCMSAKGSGRGSEEWTRSPLPRPQLPLSPRAGDGEERSSPKPRRFGDEAFLSPKRGRDAPLVRANAGDRFLSPDRLRSKENDLSSPIRTLPCQPQTPGPRTPMPTVKEQGPMEHLETWECGVLRSPVPPGLPEPSVRNTFLTFDSPLRADRLRSPPKSVPANYAPRGAENHCWDVALPPPPELAFDPPAWPPCTPEARLFQPLQWEHLQMTKDVAALPIRLSDFLPELPLVTPFAVSSPFPQLPVHHVTDSGARTESGLPPPQVVSVFEEQDQVEQQMSNQATLHISQEVLQPTKCMLDVEQQQHHHPELFFQNQQVSTQMQCEFFQQAEPTLSDSGQSQLEVMHWHQQDDSGMLHKHLQQSLQQPCLQSFFQDPSQQPCSQQPFLIESLQQVVQQPMLQQLHCQGSTHQQNPLQHQTHDPTQQHFQEQMQQLQQMMQEKELQHQMQQQVQQQQMEQQLQQMQHMMQQQSMQQPHQQQVQEHMHQQSQQLMLQMQYPHWPAQPAPVEQAPPSLATAPLFPARVKLSELLQLPPLPSDADGKSCGLAAAVGGIREDEGVVPSGRASGRAPRGAKDCASDTAAEALRESKSSETVAAPSESLRRQRGGRMGPRLSTVRP